jgi:hypothetical protein
MINCPLLLIWRTMDVVLFSMCIELVLCWIAYFWSNLDNTDVLCVVVHNNRTRFWIICWVLDIRGFGFRSEFSPELIFGLDLSFRFGLWVWVPSHYIRSESDPLPSLLTTSGSDWDIDTAPHRQLQKVWLGQHTTETTPHHQSSSYRNTLPWPGQKTHRGSPLSLLALLLSTMSHTELATVTQG